MARLAEFGAAVREYYETDVSLPATVNVIDLREDISRGQQVESFAVDALLDGEWTQVAAGTTIGHRRLLPLDEPLSRLSGGSGQLSSRLTSPTNNLFVEHEGPLCE